MGLIAVISKKPTPNSRIAGTYKGKTIYPGKRFNITDAPLAKDADRATRENECQYIENLTDKARETYLTCKDFAPQWMKLVDDTEVPEPAAEVPEVDPAETEAPEPVAAAAAAAPPRRKTKSAVNQ